MSSSSLTKPSSGPNFFDLPLELRDVIYDQLWRLHPVLLNNNSRFADVHLCYEGSYQVPMDRTSVMICALAALNNRKFPPGLWASKKILQEALDQFARRAEWFWCENPEIPKQTWLSTLIHDSKVRDMTVFLDVFEPPCGACSGERHSGEWRLDEELNEVVAAMVDDGMDGHGIRRLRIEGFTEITNMKDECEEALRLARLFWPVCQRAEAEHLELSLWHNDPEGPRLYDVVGEGLDVRAVLAR